MAYVTVSTTQPPRARGRYIRSAVTVIACLALAGAILVAIAWARSHLYGDSLDHYRRPSIFNAMSTGGVLAIAWGELESEKYPPPTGWHGSFPPFQRQTTYIEADLRKGTVLGFAYARQQRRQPGYRIDAHEVRVPHWAPFLTLISIPAIVFGRRLTRRRRVGEGRCAGCGYDLRASPERCPECGTVPEAAPPSTMIRPGA